MRTAREPIFSPGAPYFLAVSVLFIGTAIAVKDVLIPWLDLPVGWHAMATALWTYLTA